MKKYFIPFFVVSVLILSGCTPKEESELAKFYEGSPQDIHNSNPELTMSDFDQTAMPEKSEQIVIMETSKGTIKIRLFPQFAPKTVENFTGLIEKGYYDGIIFHRVIPDFMIQGGDPTGTGMGGESVWGGKFEDEFNSNVHNIRGALSMANAGPGTNGSQFFIVQAESTPWLDGKHTVFGQVFEGMEVVDAIAGAERKICTSPVEDNCDKPLKDIVMKKVSLATY